MTAPSNGPGIILTGIGALCKAWTRECPGRPPSGIALTITCIGATAWRIVDDWTGR